MSVPRSHSYDAHLAATKGITEREKLYYYAGGLVKYHCLHIRSTALETDNTWDIWKFTYNGDNNITDRQLRSGAVNTEAAINALDWTI